MRLTFPNTRFTLILAFLLCFQMNTRAQNISDAAALVLQDGHRYEIQDMMPSTSSDYLISKSEGELILWDLKEGKKAKTFGYQGKVYGQAPPEPVPFWKMLLRPMRFLTSPRGGNEKERLQYSRLIHLDDQQGVMFTYSQDAVYKQQFDMNRGPKPDVRFQIWRPSIWGIGLREIQDIAVAEVFTDTVADVSLLVAATPNGKIKVWDHERKRWKSTLRTRKLKGVIGLLEQLADIRTKKWRELEFFHVFSPKTLKISSDGTRLIAAGDQTVKGWDIQKRRARLIFSDEQALDVRSIDLSNDSKELVVYSAARVSEPKYEPIFKTEVWLHQLETEEKNLIHEYYGIQSPYERKAFEHAQVSYSPDTTFLAFTSPKGIVIYNRVTKQKHVIEESHFRLRNHLFLPNLFAFDKTGKSIFWDAPETHRDIYVSDCYSGTTFNRMGGWSTRIEDLTVTPKNELILGEKRLRTLNLNSITGGHRYSNLLQQARDSGDIFLKTKFHPAGGVMALATLKLNDTVATDKRMLDFYGYEFRIGRVNNVIKDVILPTHRYYQKLYKPRKEYVKAEWGLHALLPESNVIVPLGTLEGLELSIAIDTANNRMAAATCGQEHKRNTKQRLLVYNMESGDTVMSFRQGDYYRMAFSPDGSQLAFSSSYGARLIRIMNVEDRSMVKRLGRQPFYMARLVEFLVGLGKGQKSRETLVYSPNGRYLAATNRKNTSIRIYDVQDNYRSVSLKPSREGLMAKLMNMMSSSSSDQINSLAFSPDGARILGATESGKMKVWETKSGKPLRTIYAGFNGIQKAVFSADGKNILALEGGINLMVFGEEDVRPVSNMVNAANMEDYLIWNRNDFYASTENGHRAIGFSDNDRVYSFENFDLSQHRPDAILSSIDTSQHQFIEIYLKARLKRLEKMGLSPEMLQSSFVLPGLELITENLPLSTDQDTLHLSYAADGHGHSIRSVQLWVNDVPLYGLRGHKLSEPSETPEIDIEVPLSAGSNKIQCSVRDTNGVESLKRTFFMYRDREVKPVLHIVALGASEFANPKHNLDYSQKDASDVIDALQQTVDSQYASIEIHELFNQDFTLEALKVLKPELQNTNVDDQVIVFISSHGLLDDSLNYYIATAGTDFENVENTGIPYEAIEHLLDSIPARNKLLLIDACHSGEMDEETVEYYKNKKTSRIEAKDMVFKSYPITAKADSADSAQIVKVGLNTSFEWMKQLFNDVRYSTGSLVISSSSGVQLSIEGEKYQNGVFTYCVLEGLREAKADENRDGQVSVLELQAYVNSRVPELTEGIQQPTFRVEPLGNDFVLPGCDMKDKEEELVRGW